MLCHQPPDRNFVSFFDVSIEIVKSEVTLGLLLAVTVVANNGP
jgi:hypothetical protein